MAIHDDELLLAELRLLKPRIERLLDKLQEQAEEDGAFKADVRRTMEDVKYVLRELRDGSNGKPSLMATVRECGTRLDSLETWKREQAEAERERARDYKARKEAREAEQRKNRMALIIAVVGWLIAVAALISSLIHLGAK